MCRYLASSRFFYRPRGTFVSWISNDAAGDFLWILVAHLYIVAEVETFNLLAEVAKITIRARVKSERVGTPSSERGGRGSGDGFPGRRGGVFV